MFHDHILSHNILKPTKELSDLIRAPAFSSTVGAEDSTANELYTFFRIAGDNDSRFYVERTVGLTAEGVMMSATNWTVRELPVIATVATDQADNNILAEGTTEITITGDYFGGDLSDISVYVGFQGKKRFNTLPLEANNRFYPATVISGTDIDESGGDAELVCSITLSRFSSGAEIVEPLVGSPVQIYIQNNKRLLRSDIDTSAVLI